MRRPSATLLRLAFLNTLANRKYSIGAFVSIASGFVALCLFRAYIADVDRLYQDTYEHRNMYGQMLVRRGANHAARYSDPWKYGLDRDDQAYLHTLLKSHDVTRVRFLTGSGMIATSRVSAPFFAKAYDIEPGAKMRGHRWASDVSAGMSLDIAGSTDAIVIGRGLATTLGCRIERTHAFECPEYNVQLEATTEAGQSNVIEASIVGIVDGIFKELDERYVMLSTEKMQRLFDTDKVSFASIATLRPSQAQGLISALSKDPGLRSRGIEIIRWQDSEDGDLYRRTIELLSIFQGFVVTIMVVITALSIFNTFLKAIWERSRELGTLRSIGFSRYHLIKLFVYESTLQSTGGITCGAAVSLLVTAVVNHLSVSYRAGLLSEPVAFKLAWDVYSYASSAVFLWVLSLVSALLAVSGTCFHSIPTNLRRT